MTEAGFLATHLERLSEAARTAAPLLEEAVGTYATWAWDTLRSGGRLLFCGNGGSGATAEHVAAEYVIRFRRHRRPLAALALPGSAVVLTAGANDLGFEETYARALEAVAGPHDLLVLHSTSGDSPNLLVTADAARRLGLRTVALLGAGGGRLEARVDLPIAVPAGDAATVQELHLAIEHAVVGWVEARLPAESDGLTGSDVAPALERAPRHGDREAGATRRADG